MRPVVTIAFTLLAAGAALAADPASGDKPLTTALGVLRARVDVGAISRRDEGESHPRTPSRSSRTGPAGSAATTSAAGGCARLCLAARPGSGSIAYVAGRIWTC